MIDAFDTTAEKNIGSFVIAKLAGRLVMFSNLISLRHTRKELLHIILDLLLQSTLLLWDFFLIQEDVL
jgi:hypothetical protein